MEIIENKYKTHEFLSWKDTTHQLDVPLFENIVDDTLVLLRQDGAGGVDQVATSLRLGILIRETLRL